MCGYAYVREYASLCVSVRVCVCVCERGEATLSFRRKLPATVCERARVYVHESVSVCVLTYL